MNLVLEFNLETPIPNVFALLKKLDLSTQLKLQSQKIIEKRMACFTMNGFSPIKNHLKKQRSLLKQVIEEFERGFGCPGDIEMR